MIISLNVAAEFRLAFQIEDCDDGKDNERRHADYGGMLVSIME